MDKKALLPLPFGDKNKFHEDTKTLTTSTFFRVKPIYVKEVLPGETVNINVSTLTRLGSLQKPMYGDVRQQLRAFFVPMRLVFPNWNDFIVNTDGNNSPYTHVPTFSHKEFMKFLFAREWNTATQVHEAIDEHVSAFIRSTPVNQGSQIACDFYGTYLNTENTFKFFGFVFTPLGRRFMDIMYGLGYNFNLGVSPRDASELGADEAIDEVFSAMPFLCYAKLFCDWFTNSQYASTINTLQATINTIYTRGYMVANDFSILANLITYVTYDRDMFVSAFDRPSSPNDSHGTLDNIRFVDLTNNALNDSNKSRVDANAPTDTPTQYNPTNGTPVMRSNGQGLSPTNITQYALDCLRKLTNYVRRNQIAGVRALDRYYARYGVQLTSEKLLRSQLLGSYDIPFDISDIMSTADTVGIAANQSYGTNLGDYAGQGIGGASGININYNSDGEFGFLIITADILPFVRYYQGLQPHCSHIYVSEFYQPEFDGLSVDIVPQKQLYNDFLMLKNDNVEGGDDITDYRPDGDFGYFPRYYDKKTQPYAILSGAFHLGSRNTGLDAWHLMRKVNTQYMAQTSWKHSENFTNATADGEQYNRIFQDTDADLDGFISVFNFNVTSYKPIMKMFDNWVLSEDDSEHHGKASISVGGTSIR